ncbi:MAG: ATP-binding cassette domain-containing protein [Lachnospiraceae bacterium]|nr:ATP-binding cassette domain-containing protein [Lachnospiraceae bacterium]
MNVLQTINLKKYYGTEPNITRALDGVNLSVEQGEFVAVVETSGSGKSTLLNMMGGLDTPTSGSVIVRGDELAKKSDEELTIFRRRNIGFIFQNYNLVPILNVCENIVLPVGLDGDVLGLLKRTSMEFNQSIVMITHNNEIAQLVDRIVRIEDGKIVE